MGVPVLVADLDDTLVDTSRIKHHRERRDWAAAKANLAETAGFPGVSSFIDQLRSEGVRVGILTTSVSNYAAAVCSYHKIRYDALVAYHDCRPKIKPDPYGVELCLKKLDGDKELALGLGDRCIDARSYRASSILAWGAGWSHFIDGDADWDFIAFEPMQILKHFRTMLAYTKSRITR